MIDYIYNAITRLNYIPKELKYNSTVDNNNKYYNTNADPYKVLFDILFFITPKFIYNTIINNIGNKKELDVLKNIINNIDISCINTQYRNIDIFKDLHPNINVYFRNNIKDLVKILIYKFLDEKDNYFNIRINNRNSININNITNININTFINKFKDINLILSGSLALAMYGTVYRNKIKDLDFLIDKTIIYDDVYKNLLDCDNITTTFGKQVCEIEKEIKYKFEYSSFYNIINNILNNKVFVRSAVIDRGSSYDKQNRCSFVLQYDDIEFDLISKDNINYTIINNIKVQKLKDILNSKRLLGRPKDFEDIINFVPYNRNVMI